MPDVSIIVRTKNEERWIGHCLSMIFQQDHPSFEVVLVDNASTDHTVQVANRYPIARTVTIENFRPGLALNEGIRASSGRYIVCLSAHCIPKGTDWLSCLQRNFDGDEKVAGVYGRQLPLSFTDAVDKRDLLIVFGQDRRRQVKDYFFHNANSMLRRDVWETFPFDEQVSNIEDRVWGKAVTASGYHLVYDPDAAVYHHHGLHQGNAPERARGVVSVIQQIDDDVFNELPESLRPEHANIAAVVPIQGRVRPGTSAHDLLRSTLESLRMSRYIDNIYVISELSELVQADRIHWIDRAGIQDADKLGMDEFLQAALGVIESRGDYPDSLLYVNHDYVNRPAGIFDELIADAQYKGYDTVFPGLVDYNHYWFRNADGDFRQTDPSMKGRSEREPVFRALYGLGCAVSVSVVRGGRLVGGRVGILPLDDSRYAVRLRDLQSRSDATESVAGDLAGLTI